jgi:F-type H+-transporting ATPase subunit b
MEALGIQWPALVGQIVNFLLLLALLRLTLYKPVMNMLDQRAGRIRESMERAEEIKREHARAQEQYAAEIDRARKEAQGIIAQANQIAQRISEEERARAKQEAEQFLTRARAEIDGERRRAVSELRGQVADVALLAAGRIIGRSLDKTAHVKLIEETLAETDKLN